MRRLSPFAELPGFGLLLGSILVAVFLPALVVSYGLRPRPLGIEVLTSIPPTILADPGGKHVLVSVVRAEGCDIAPGTVEFRVDSRPVSPADLQAAIWLELTTHVRQIIFVEGEGCVGTGEVLHAVDLAAWAGVPVVLLTPKLKQSYDRGRDAAPKPRRG
jgi:hypothetical protein